MFQVYRNGRKQFKVLFPTYEAARQQVRKFMRANVSKLAGPRPPGANPRHTILFGMWDNVSRNPTNYTNSGFTIKKVQE